MKEAIKGKRTPGMEVVARALPKSIHALGENVEHLFYCHSVLCHWQDIVGGPVARNVEAVRILKKTLWLYTYDASWRNQIALMARDIIQRVNNFAGEALVDELRFANSGSERRALLEETPDEGIDYRALLPRIRLTEAEIEAARASCAAVEDDDLRERLFRLSLLQAKREHLHRALGFHPCKDCGVLCAPERERCSVCEGKHQADVRAAVRRCVEETPWARFCEVKAEIPEADPEMLASVRAAYVQHLAKGVLLMEPDTMKAKTLTMAFRCVPPEALTKDLILRTLYRLRKDLAQPKEWKPVKRYEYLRWGKEKKWRDWKEEKTDGKKADAEKKG